jgi:prepilin-type N-terminal cleavage/methylation domain-containing protein
MRVRKGFTLIELVVSIALLLVFIGMAFSTLSNYYGAKSANEQEMIIEQNFRSAMERMGYDFAQAGSNPGIESPVDNTVSKSLVFHAPDLSKITYSVVKDPVAGTCYINKRTVVGVSTTSDEPVTEVMHQLVDVYFVRSRGKITVIIAGRVMSLGSQRSISFASMLVSRNYYTPSASNP